MSAASFSHPDHFQEAFNPQERQELLDEDTAAFSGVTGILIFVIGVGVALAAFSVAVIFCDELTSRAIAASKLWSRRGHR